MKKKMLRLQIQCSCFQDCILIRPHKERLATLHAICLQISHHISQKCSWIHQVFTPLFVSSDEKFDDASVAQSLCGIAITVLKEAEPVTSQLRAAITRLRERRRAASYPISYWMNWTGGWPPNGRTCPLTTSTKPDRILMCHKVTQKTTDSCHNSGKVVK